MLLFSYNAFLLGALFFLTTALVNIIFVWLCKIWKVKVLEFSIFLDPWFSLFKKENNGTIYKLGWLPLGAYIKPLGETKEDLQGIAIEELPFSLSNKSSTKQVFFLLTPYLVFLFVLLLSLYTLKGSGNILQAIEEMFNYISVALKTMFGFSSVSEFGKMTNNMLIDKNIISFALILLMSLYLILNPLSKIMNLDTQGEKKINLLKVIKVIAGIIILFGTYLTFWKIPKFVFSFFSFRQNVSYMVSFVLGLYFIGSIIFILSMIIVKLVPVRKK
jgi:hypothetical protein